MTEHQARIFPPPPHNRVAIRLRAEMQSSAAAAGIAAFAGDLDRSIIFGLLLREGCALPPVADPDLADICAEPRTVTINALAATLLRPFETVRRYANALIDEGLCSRAPGGVLVRPDAIDHPPVRTMLVAFHDLLVRMMEDTAWYGMPLPPRADVAYDPRVGLAAALDMLLLAVEHSARHYASWFEMALLETVMCANARPFTYDQAISLTYPDYTRPVPDSLRAPIRIASVVRALGVPYSTARRHAEAMIAHGRMLRVSGGLLVSEAWLSNSALLEDREHTMSQGAAIYARLAAGGFPFEDPARAYVQGRPPLLAFE